MSSAGWMEKQRAFLHRELSPLLGAKVVKVALSIADGDVWPVLEFRCKDGVRHVVVQRDAEGNGPGWLHVVKER